MSSRRAESILSESASCWSDRAAVIDAIGQCTFAQLSYAAGEVARTLESVNVHPGAVIGISVSRAQTFLAALFGILSADCVAIPVAPNVSAIERSRLITETGVEWLFEETPIGAAGDVQLSLSRQAQNSNSVAVRAFPDAAVIRHTSGTTARSKGVVLSHQAVLERVEASQQLLALTHNDVVLVPLPLSYHFIASALSCVKAGATILDCANTIAPEMLALGARWGATMIYASPIQYELLSRTENATPLPMLKRAIATSALLPKRTAEVFFERFGVRLTQVYGIIEVGLPLWNELESIEPTALGICKEPYEAMVIDEEGNEVAAGEIGELAIRGPGLFAGYLLGEGGGATPCLAETCLRNREWFLTGDLVARDELGVILYRGRKKSVINCGGNKIFPEEVEEVLRQSPDIISVRVSAEPHHLLGSIVIAEVVVDSNQPQGVERWRELCNQELSSYKVPREFRLVESLPSTGSGKIVRYEAGHRRDQV